MEARQNEILYQGKLQYLHNLTHERINSAIQQAYEKITLDKNQRPEIITGPSYTSKFYTYISPHFRLAKILSDKPDIAFAILAELMQTKIEVFDNNSGLIRAIKIFLNFKTNPAAYKSPVCPGNTCLNDALHCRELWKEITSLLISNGANPFQENDKKMDALIYFLIFHYPSISPEFLLLPDHTPVERLIRTIAGVLADKDVDSMVVLETLDLYNVFTQYPSLINMNCLRESYKKHSLLHVAAECEKSEVIDYLVSKGADADLLDVNDDKPIFSAVIRLLSIVDENSPVFTDTIKSIAQLLLFSLHRSFPDYSLTVTNVAEAVLDLPLAQSSYREKICSMLFSPGSGANKFIFTLDALLQTLRDKEEILKHHEIKLEVDNALKVGSGSHATVFKAIQENCIKQKTVAIKLAKKQSLVGVMKNEAKIHAEFHHENIISYFCTIERYNLSGIVMEFANNGDLFNFLCKNDTKTCHQYFPSFGLQMMAGLKYLHDLGYVHLDFKSANLLLTDFTLKIGDLGTVNKTGKLKSRYVTTFMYCSPEGFDLSVPYDFKRDIYSAGIVFGEIETQTSAFSPKTSFEIIRNEVTAGKRGTFNTKPMRKEAAQLVRWCCKQKPEERPDCNEITAYIKQNFKLG